MASIYARFLSVLCCVVSQLNYGDPDVYITENGRSDHDEQPPITEDADRICYYMGYIDEVLKGKHALVYMHYRVIDVCLFTVHSWSNV